MTKRMLIDATHAEETRVVVLDGNRLEDFDVETETKKQLKGNIYLAKVVRVEPSLQAAFVEYGGGRHGFLAFGEIHPDYYQIPVADRQRLLAMQAEEARAEEDEDEPEQARPARPARGERRPRRAHADQAPASEAAVPPEMAEQPEILHPGVEAGAPDVRETPSHDADAHEASPDADAAPDDERPAQPALIPQDVKYGEVTFGEFAPGETVAEANEDAFPPPAEAAADGEANGEPDSYSDIENPLDQPPPETIGGESDVFEGNGAEEARARRSSRFLRNYRIQEVIHRRQIMLVQVVKEERGTKGAALTTYISLAGRFCVLMPNSPRGGGVSRKITSAADRRRLKDIIAELDVPDGMGMIVRTAGANRPKPEIKRDCEYLMRLWDDIREHTLRSVAPALIYEEASLIKRAIRDVYSRDVDEVLVDGEEGWKAAHEFMRMLMPSHAKKVQLWKDGGNPLFSKNNVEAQLDAMLAPNVQLRSGGYLVINQAEALVAIDVNSGRSTRERGIEETALRTNLEAADEVARQLRLRDLAGLIVIDFIDMESRKNNAMVERRMKEALKNDRARIQVGHISHFGLLEMSRQRLRPSLAETTFVTCPHCSGLGHVRSIESSAIHVLRAIEEEGGKARASLIMVHVANVVVMYILNHKRERLAEIEARTGMRVHFSADETLVPPSLRIERVRAAVPASERLIAAPVLPVAPPRSAIEDDEEEADVTPEDDEAVPVRETAAVASGELGAAAAEDGDRPRRRRRRRRGGRRDGTETGPANEPGAEQEAGAAPDDEGEEDGEAGGSEAEGGEDVIADAGAPPRPAEVPELVENGQPRARRRGRRGGRRRRRDGSPGAPWTDDPRGEGAEASEAPREAAPDPIPPPPAPAPIFSNVYTGPTPADPFGGQQAFDIFDLMEQTEAAAAARPAAPEKPVAEPVARAPVTPAPVTPPPAPPETVAVPETVAAAEPEAPPAPLVKPIVLGQDPVPAAERKRGWWRR